MYITCLPYCVPKGKYSVQYTRKNMYCLQKNRCIETIMSIDSPKMTRCSQHIYFTFLLS